MWHWLTGSSSGIGAAVARVRRQRLAAVNHMTKLLAKALGPEVRVNAVAPGMIDTPWFDGRAGADKAMEEVAGAVPLGRVGKPEDIAEAVYDLTRAAYITGEVLLIDGGGHLL